MRFRGITKRLAPVLALVGLLAAIVATSVAGASTTKVCSFHAGGVLADAKCTPGVISPSAGLSQICNTTWVNKHQPSSSTILKLMKTVSTKYGVLGKPGYALDLRVPIQLGGAIAEANAWPQPTDMSLGWYAKQAMATQLRQAVCEGVMPLKKAQAVMQGYWPNTTARLDEASWSSR